MSFSFTRKVDYALVGALATLANPGLVRPIGVRTPTGGHTGGRPSDNSPVSLSAQQIADMQGLPPRVVTNVLKRLHSAGLIQSRRGAGGGYWLARSASEISVAEVLTVIQGPVKLNVCCGEHEPTTCLPCQAMPRCPITGSIRRLNQMLVGVLEGVTIADLISQRLTAIEPGLMADPLPRRTATPASAPVPITLQRD